ncbi:MAG: glycerol-3-phosphate 1-O-acyltransferase [Pseudomonadota bacterium]
MSTAPAPWPADTAAPVLFIIDASHRPERQLLGRWLDTTRPTNPPATLHRVVLPIATRPEDIDAISLMPFLQGDPETIVVPVRVVWGDGRDSARPTPRIRDLLRGNTRRPGASRAERILRKTPDRAQCIAGASATLAELRARWCGDDEAAFARFVADQAGLTLDIAERQQRGGRYKVPRRVAQNLRRRPAFREALTQIAEQTGESVAALDERADEIFKELIAIPRTFWQDVMAAFNRKVISMGYEPRIVIDAARLEALRETVRTRPSVLLWTHKTHIDGFAVYSMLFENDFPVPHLLGGVNMAFGGLGYAARRSGGIFIRRSFQDDLLYKMILRQYLGYLLEKRFPLTWAFEGTRSRVGKLMPPRYGILKYVAEAARASGDDNLRIIPVALNYDLIRDVRDYVKEQGGGVKQPESLRWFIGYVRGLRQPLGKIYIDVGEPVILRDIPEDDDLALKKIAFQVGVETNRVTPITVTSLVTTILLGAAPRALTRLELGKEMLRYLSWARARDIPVTDDFERDQLEHFNDLAQVLNSHGLVEHFDDGPDTVYALAPEQHPAASYYRNTTIHHFVVKAFSELALLRAGDAETDRLQAFWSAAERLRELFKFEFFYAPREAFRDEVEAELNRYDPAWQSKLDADPAYASDLLRRFRPLVARAAVLPFVEAYRVVANVLSRMPADEDLTAADCLERSLALGRQAYLQRRISSEASIGKLFFENGYRLIDNLGLTQAGDAELTSRREALSREFRELANRLERLRVLALPGDDW